MIVFQITATLVNWKLTSISDKYDSFSSFLDLRTSVSLEISLKLALVMNLTSVINLKLIRTFTPLSCSNDNKLILEHQPAQLTLSNTDHHDT